MFHIYTDSNFNRIIAILFGYVDIILTCQSSQIAVWSVAITPAQFSFIVLGVTDMMKLAEDGNGIRKARRHMKLDFYAPG